MDLTKFMPNWKNKDAEDIEERPLTALERLAARRNHGPVKTKTFSNGQIRRMMERDQRTQHRKAVLRQRREWMDARLAVASLRGQLAIVGTDHPVAGAAERNLVSVFGSVEAARESYAKVEAAQA